MRSASLLLLSMLFASCASALPDKLGHIYQLSDPDTAHAVEAARLHLARSVPAYHVFRVWIESSDEAWVYYRSNGGSARHLIVRRIKGGWRVTGAPQSIDTDLKDVIMTP